MTTSRATRAAADLKTPVQIGENFYGPCALYTVLQMKACDYVVPDLGGLAASQAGNERPRSLGRRAFRFRRISIPRWPPTLYGSAKDALAGMAGLGEPGVAAV